MWQFVSIIFKLFEIIIQINIPKMLVGLPTDNSEAGQQCLNFHRYFKGDELVLGD